jgi:uncharacterized membrane protein
MIVKDRTRYTVLLFAGVADLAVGVYVLTLVIFTSLSALEFAWMTAAGFLTLFTGFYLAYRVLPTLISLRRGETAPILRDERTIQVLHRAARNAFIFLVAVLPILVALPLGMSKLGVVLTFTELAATTMMAWIVAIVIFYASIVYYNRT